MYSTAPEVLRKTRTIHPLELYLICEHKDHYLPLFDTNFYFGIDMKRCRVLRNAWRQTLIVDVDEWEMTHMEGQVRQYQELYGGNERGILDNWDCVKLGFAVGVQYKNWEN